MKRKIIWFSNIWDFLKIENSILADFNFSRLIENDKEDDFDTDYGNLIFNAPEKCLGK